MTAPFVPIDLEALDLTSETGQQNALNETITILNSVLDLLNGAGSTVPLLGTGNSGGLLTATQKAKLTGGPQSNADSLHTHSGVGSGGTGGGNALAGYLLTAADPSLSSARVIGGAAGQITLNDLGPGTTLSIGLADSGAVAGQYTKVTADSKGRIVSGGVLLASDIPSHVHSAADITTGTLLSGRFGAKSVAIGALDPGSATDGWILTVSGGLVVASAAPAGTGEVNTASTIGTLGLSLFKSKVGADLQFRSLNPSLGIVGAIDALSNSLSLTPDYGTNTNQIARGDHVHDARYYQKSEVDNLIRVLNSQTKTANYQITASDQIIRADSSSSAIILTLPDATGNIGKVIRVKRVNAGVNVVHIVPLGGDKIDALYTDWELWDRNEYVSFTATNGNWEVTSASYSNFIVDLGPIGAGRIVTVKPQFQNFKLTATVDNAVLTLNGFTQGQAAHVQLMSGAGGFRTIFAGVGAAKWPGGVAQPGTSTAGSLIDEVFATFNGTDTLFSYRGQGY